MNLFRVMLGLGLCGGLVLPCFSRHATAVDIVTARIECPSFTVATLGWTPKIGSDPTFGAPTGTYDVGVPFVSMSRQGQTFTALTKPPEIFIARETSVATISTPSNEPFTLAHKRPQTLWSARSKSDQNGFVA